MIHDEDIGALDHRSKRRVVAILVAGEGNAATAYLDQIAKRRHRAMFDANGA